MIKKSILCILSLALMASCSDLDLNSGDVPKTDSGTNTSASAENGDSGSHSEVVLNGETSDRSSDMSADEGGEFSESESAPVVASSAGGFEQLVSNFENMSGADIATTLNNLSPTELQILAIYPAFAGFIHLKGCEADANLMIQTTQGIENCQTQYVEWQNHFQLTMQLFGSLNGAFDQVIRERGQLQVSIGCDNGTIDAASCQAYISGTAQINQSSHETSMAIINNLGGGSSCLVNQDPNCTPY